MEEKIVNAYLHLLYKSLVEIRAMSVFPRKWWNPLSWGKQNKALYQINQLSNVFHNLPYDLRTDTQSEIDEKRFWEMIKNYELLKKDESYKSIFEKVINGEKRKILD